MPLSAPAERAEAANTLTVGVESAGDLLERLAEALGRGGIGYCQWKGFWKPAGEGDIDLLVDRDAMGRFRSIVEELGFKPVLPSGERQVPGVESYLGFDPNLTSPLHLHVHYRLVVGDFWRTQYRLPFEKPLLESVVAGIPFPVPAPPYQFLIYVLRMVLRSRGWLIPRAHPRWIRGLRGQLSYLEGRTNPDAVEAVLARHLPSIDLPFLDRCMLALRAETDPVESGAIRRDLHRRLRAHTRRPTTVALLSAAGEKILPGRFRPMLFDGLMRPAGGGTVVALVGGDGAGKSTCARELHQWLSNTIPTMHAHLGRPPRSLLTLAIGGGLKAEQLLYRLRGRTPETGSHIEMLRHLCTARDRYLLYGKVRRFAAGGGVAICERYPVPQNRFLVGPVIPDRIGPNPSAVAKLLRDWEISYYNRMLLPDALFVLRLDPELAVLRKPDEPADYVRLRAGVVWDTDWSGSGAHVIDVSRSLPEVLRILKGLVWSVI